MARWIKDAGQGSDSTRDAGTLLWDCGENKSVIGGMMGGAVHKGGTINRRNYMGPRGKCSSQLATWRIEDGVLISHSTTRNRGGVKIA
jgi:hypothetical protein